jgi:hypothetical protein
LVLAFSLLIGGSDGGSEAPKATAPPVPAAPTTRHHSFDDDLIFRGAKIIPASDGSGDYLVTRGGLWLLRGDEAMKVREVDRLSSPPPTTLPVRPVLNIDVGDVNVDASTGR